MIQVLPPNATGLEPEDRAWALGSSNLGFMTQTVG